MIIAVNEGLKYKYTLFKPCFLSFHTSRELGPTLSTQSNTMVSPVTERSWSAIHRVVEQMVCKYQEPNDT